MNHVIGLSVSLLVGYVTLFVASEMSGVHGYFIGMGAAAVTMACARIAGHFDPTP